MRIPSYRRVIVMETFFDTWMADSEPFFIRAGATAGVLVAAYFLGFTFLLLVLMVLVVHQAPTLIHGRLAILDLYDHERQASRASEEAEEKLESALEKVEQLKIELKLSREAIAEMSRQLDAAGAASQGGPPDYELVGLAANAPAYLIEAAQKAHRIALHPDRQPPAKQQAANQQFAEMEAAFRRIRGTK